MSRIVLDSSYSYSGSHDLTLPYIRVPLHLALSLKSTELVCSGGGNQLKKEKLPMESQGPKNLPAAGWHWMLVTSDEKRDLEVRGRSKDNLEETEQNPAAAPASSQPVPEKGNGAGLKEGHSCSQNQPATATVSGAPATQVNPHNPNPAAGVPPVRYREMQERWFRGTRYEAQLLLTGQASLTTQNPI